MLQRISRTELLQAQCALVVAILLQIIASRVGGELLPHINDVIILIEVVLAIVIGFTVNIRRTETRGVHHLFAIVLLAILSVANIGALVLVLNALIIENAATGGKELLVSAIVIFLTNIIVYALWYWEVDSPGLTRTRWSKHDKDFQFTQQDMTNEFPGWHPEFADYIYLSITNAVNFAPADTRPLTRQAKLLMASQSLVSVFTLALVVARSVSILGS